MATKKVKPGNANLYLVKCSLIAALGGLLFGFDTAVISGTEQTLRTLFDSQYQFFSKKYFGSESFWHGLAVASALIGTIVGALGFGKPADIYGRRAMLFILALLYLTSALGSAFAWDFTSLSVFRLIGGIAVGGASVVSPMYIAEISPAKYRGRLVAITQFNIVLGILLAFISNYAISIVIQDQTAWRWMFGVEAFPALLFFILLFSVPRSPRWLMSKGKREEASEVLSRVGTDNGSVEKEIEEIQETLDLEKEAMRERFRLSRYFRPLSMGVLIAAFNQLSGINAVMYFAPRIFSMSGFDQSAALLGSVGVGLVNLLITIIALSIIDHFGRKKLMLIGSIGYLVSLGAIAVTFYSFDSEFRLVSMLQGSADTNALNLAIENAALGGKIVMWSLFVFVAAHAFGQGTVIWVFISEIFPNKVRARGIAISSSALWIMAACISWTFPIFAEQSGGHIFAFYWVCMLGQLVWVIFMMPETRRISLEQIEKQLKLS